MINGLRPCLAFVCALCTTISLADTVVIPNQQDDPNGTCTAFLEQPDTNPPTGSTDPDTINAISACLANCNQLYNWYSDQGQFDTMQSGISYCRTSLTALYYQSIYQQTDSNLNASVSTGSPNQSSPSIEENIQPVIAPAPTPSNPTATPTGKQKQASPSQINWF